MNRTSVEGPEHHEGDPADEPLASVVAGRDREDDHGQFQAAAGGDLLCLTCRTTFHPATQRADDIDRVEGASDPADAALVMRVRCPHCSTSGVLVVRYGPEASEDEADLLVGMRRDPSDADPT